jgi:hypothetical protein
LETIPRKANLNGVVVLPLSDWMATQQYQIVRLPGDFGKFFENLVRNLILTWCRYQMLDAFMGLFYTFFTTLAILYSLKAVRSIFKGKWAPVFKNANKKGRWKLEATPQHAWKETS